jgi:hypothetical protein
MKREVIIIIAVALPAARLSIFLVSGRGGKRK